MREIRLYGSEGGGAASSPYPYQLDPGFRRGDDKVAAGFHCHPPGSQPRS